MKLEKNIGDNAGVEEPPRLDAGQEQRHRGGTRRDFLRAGFALAAAETVPLVLAQQSSASARHGSPWSLPPSNGGAQPYPIPWLDKNGNHNQPAGPMLEPSHIYHFKGRIARCAGFTGMGTDNRGNRIAFGTATTDYGLMQGEYWAARTAKRGTFTHI